MCPDVRVVIESFDDLIYCKRCIKASEDTTTEWKDSQHKLITDTKQGCIVTTPRINRD